MPNYANHTAACDISLYAVQYSEEAEQAKKAKLLDVQTNFEMSETAQNEALDELDKSEEMFKKYKRGVEIESAAKNAELCQIRAVLETTERAKAAGEDQLAELQAELTEAKATYRAAMIESDAKQNRMVNRDLFEQVRRRSQRWNTSVITDNLIAGREGIADHVRP